MCIDLHTRVMNGKAVEDLVQVSNDQSIMKVGSGTFSEVRRSVHKVSVLRRDYTQIIQRPLILASSSHDT